MKHISIMVVSIVLLGNCMGDPNSTADTSQTERPAHQAFKEDTLSERIRADLETLSGARIFFGHQSVGFNILAGLADIATRAGIVDIAIRTTDESSGSTQPAVTHATIGRNKDPKSKIDDFEARMRGSKDFPPDIALMKLCYVDFDPGTDVEELFSYYQAAIERLKNEYPGTTFVHVTVPLTTQSMGLRSRVYRLIGRREWSDASNILRNEYNQRLSDVYASDPIFDLARAESTRPDGTRVMFHHNGNDYYVLNPGYTDDGGHLNEVGSATVAAEMASVIADAVRTRIGIHGTGTTAR